MSLLAGIAAGLSLMGGTRRNRANNFKADFASIIPDNQDFYNKEFLQRNKDYTKNILQGAGVSDNMFDRAARGNRFAIDNISDIVDANSDVLTESKSIFQAGDARKTGAEITNSTPKYEAPAYGKQGMKLRAKSKFSL